MTKQAKTKKITWTVKDLFRFWRTRHQAQWAASDAEQVSGTCTVFTRRMFFTLTQCPQDGACTHKSCFWQSLGGGVSLTLTCSLCFGSRCILEWFGAMFASEENGLWIKLQKWTIQQIVFYEKPNAVKQRWLLSTKVISPSENKRKKKKRPKPNKKQQTLLFCCWFTPRHVFLQIEFTK